MISWILQDIKRTIKSKKSFLLFTVIVLSIAAFIGNFYYDKYMNQVDFDKFDNIESLNSGFNDAETISNVEVNFMLDCRVKYSDEGMINLEEDEGFKVIGEDVHSSNDKVSKKDDELDCASYYTFKKLYNEAYPIFDSNTEFSEEDLRFQMEARLYLLDVATDNIMVEYGNADQNRKDYLKRSTYDIEEILKIKNFIKSNISYKFDDLDLSDAVLRLDYYNDRSLNLYHLYTVYINNYPETVAYDLTSSFFIANYLNEYFLLLTVVVALLVFDSYYRDFNSGVIKTILTSPTRRIRYFIMKSVSSVVSMIILLFSPLIITWLILYAVNGYDSIDYPIFISKNALSSYSPSMRYSRVINSYKPYPNYSRYKDICSIAPVSQFVTESSKSFSLESGCLSSIPLYYFTLIPLSKYILLVFSYLLLVIIFISALNTLFSLLFNHQIINLIAILLSISLSLVLNKLFIGKVVLKILPFTFLAPTRLLMGTTPYTFLNGVVTISIWSLVLAIINLVIIKRKDFTY